jgi:hypothetical protein
LLKRILLVLREVSLANPGADACDVGREARCGVAEECADGFGEFIAFAQ